MLHTRVTTSYLYSPVLCLEHWLLPRVRKDFGVQGEETVMSQWLSGDLRGQLHIILEARKSGDWYGKLDVINIPELYKVLVEQAKGAAPLPLQAATTVMLQDAWRARIQEISADEARIGKSRVG